jgi:transcription termination/antitermination protein NusG
MTVRMRAGLPWPRRRSNAAHVSESTELLAPHEGRSWCAIHTKARHEKKIAAFCGGLRIPCYLPLALHRTFSGGKVNTFELPMFPGYVFAAVAPTDWLPLKQTNSVAQRIETRNETGLLRDLSHVRILELARVELAAATTLRRGQRVVVIAGPLVGVEGVVVRQKNRTRLQVAIEAIGQGLLLDIERDALVPLV